MADDKCSMNPDQRANDKQKNFLLTVYRCRKTDSEIKKTRLSSACAAFKAVMTEENEIYLLSFISL